MRRAPLVALSLAAGLLAGCSLLPPPAGIQGTIPADQDWPALPVTVVDHAGIVASIAPGSGPSEADVNLTGAVTAIPGRDDGVLVTWLGGECDDRSIITIDLDGDRYRLSVESRSSATSCSAVGLIRRLALTLTKPVDADAFVTP